MPFTQAEICRALEAGEFVPHFQPLVDLRLGELHGFEILARWQHRTLGVISPGVFIPLLERYRLMNNLSAALLIPAFAAARSLPANFGLSVNLSPPQLHDRSLPRLIEVMADEAEFDLRRLTVELTETALVDDLELAGAVARDLKRIGVRLALDDFGTGYSSLLHLQSLPFDELKIDASFVRGMTQTRQSRKITAAVISLGLSLGLETVAEGVEERAQANLLAWQGCHLGQGFLYGSAVSIEHLPLLVEQRANFPCVTAEVPVSVGSASSLEAQPNERFSQLRAIYDGAPVGLAFLNTQLRYVNLNQRLAQFNNRPIQEHLGRKVSEVVPASLYTKFEPYLLRALNGESFSNVEASGLHVPGQPVRTLLLSYEPVRDEAGEILGVCVSVADATEHKRAADELRCSEARLRAIFDAAPVGIILVESSTGIVLKTNPRAEELVGFRFTPGMMWSPDGWQAFRASGEVLPKSRMPLTRAVYYAETTRAEDLLLKRPDGVSVWLNVTAAPVWRDDGSQWGAVMIVQDIDAARREQQKVLELTRMLDSLTPEMMQAPIA